MSSVTPPLTQLFSYYHPTRKAIKTEIYYRNMINITPNKGNSSVCIIILSHVGTRIHSIISLTLAYVQRKHQGIQVPYIVPYLGLLKKSNKYYYN